MSSKSATSRNSSPSSPVPVADSTRTSRTVTGQNLLVDNGLMKH